MSPIGRILLTMCYVDLNRNRYDLFVDLTKVQLVFPNVARHRLMTFANLLGLKIKDGS